MKRLLYTLVFLAFGGQLKAEILLSANYFKYSRQEQIPPGGPIETEISSYDLNLQMMVSSRFLIGVTQMTESTSGSTRGIRETIAPNIGFFIGPLLIEGGPVSRSIEKPDLSLSEEWREGSGNYIALTFYDRWANWLLIGFQFTFLDIEYKKYFDGSVELASQSKSVSVLKPSLRLSFLF